MANLTEVRVPDIGEFEDVEIIDVLVKDGDRLEAEDPLITLESDKAAMDVPSPHSGIVKSIKVSKGDKVSEGALILELEITGADESAAQPVVEASAGVAEPPPSEAVPVVDSGTPVFEEIRVPDIGDFQDVEIIDVMITAGVEVAVEDPVVTLESDKAAMDVPSPFAGTITEVKIGTGDRVSEGDAIATIRVSEGPSDTVRMPSLSEQTVPEKRLDDKKIAAPVTSPAEAEPPPPPPKPSASAGAALPPIRPPVREEEFAKAHASPSVRKFARELGVDLGRVEGTGHKGRITHDDVKVYVKSALMGEAGPAATALPQVPDVDFAKFGEVEIRPLNRIQKISGPRLHASWVNVPHVTQFDEADITELEATRQDLKAKAAERGIKLTPLAFVLKACVKALKEFPEFNASLDPAGENLVLKKYFHLGFAADTPNGLVVPVIRDADSKDIYEIAGALGELSNRAREGKLRTEDIQGGVFTVSSLGGIGGTAFTPIINAPEVAILGVSRSVSKPVYLDGEFVPRLMLPLSLSYDHRVIDGASAVRFTTYLASVLADVHGLLEAVP